MATGIPLWLVALCGFRDYRREPAYQRLLRDERNARRRKAYRARRNLA